MGTGGTLTPAQVADALGVSRPTVSKMLKAGQIQGYRDNRGWWRIPKEALDGLPVFPVEIQKAQSADSENAQLREQVAHLTAERDGLEKRLGDTQADRDAWRAQAERLAASHTQPQRVGFWGRFWGR